MKKLKGALLIGQSGGPTSVINASALGVFKEAFKHSEITGIYALRHGIKGILNEEFYDIRQEDMAELDRLFYTPSSAIGSVRYKLKDFSVDDTDYLRLLTIFKKHDIRYFFYNGGNDSMDTCLKISRYLKSVNYECQVIGIPKTIDNDLYGIDHSPGFGSAAKYVATTLREVALDAQVYDTKQVVIAEVMGRNAGWLTAAAQLANFGNSKVDLIYLPEVAFDLDAFFDDIKKILQTKNSVVVAVSEGIKDAKTGKFIPELYTELATDAFGHASLGGCAAVLANKVKEKLGVKVRPLELSLLQRSAAHLQSLVDVTEALEVGRQAVIAALNGVSDKFVGIIRTSNNPYTVEYPLLDLEIVANQERKIPLEWILPNGQGLTKEFNEYCLPLIQGDNPAQLIDGLPRFAKLRKVLVKK